MSPILQSFNHLKNPSTRFGIFFVKSRSIVYKVCRIVYVVDRIPNLHVLNRMISSASGLQSWLLIAEDCASVFHRVASLHQIALERRDYMRLGNDNADHFQIVFCYEK